MSSALVTRERIEILFAVDPDGGDGTLEWAIVAVTALTALACFGYVRVEWRRARIGGATSGG